MSERRPFRLAVPFDKNYDGSVGIHTVGFDIVTVDESDIDKGIVKFQYHSNPEGSQWDNFSVSVNIKSRSIKGHGSKRHRETVKEVLYWYFKVKNEKEFKELILT
ncbi:hypothetical protein LIS04_187 [Listeria phage LIS04]|nr:hypothetical protein LIS04_187 [Listeria phage LIS04]